MSPPPPRRPSPCTAGDVVFAALCRAAGGFVLALAAALVGVLVAQAWPVLAEPGRYRLLGSADWNPDRGSYGALGFVAGTAVTSALAMLVAVPLGVGAAAYLSEMASARVRRGCAAVLGLLATIPSVVYGFWGMEFLARYAVAPVFDALGLPNEAGGQGVVCAGLVLAVMVLPYVTAVSYDACRAVPRAQREGAFALGATRWQVVRRVVLPHARPGILAGCFLALGRAAGETMAVTMTVGNSPHLDWGVAATGNTIPSVIANQLPEAFGPKRAALVALGLLLLGLTLAANLAARGLVRWAARPRPVRIGQPVPLLEGLPAPAPLSGGDRDAARRRNRRADRTMTAVLAGCQVVTVVPLFLILGSILYRGVGGLSLDLFTALPAPPGEGGGGLAHAFVGSAMLVGLASLFAVPVGVGAGVFLSEYRSHRLVPPVRVVADLLGGVPSIVVGVFAYAVLVYPVWAGDPWGFSAWAGAFALGVVMLPAVVRASEEALRRVPRGLREASLALGATRWQTAVRVVLPAARPAVLTGVLLAVGRAAGEAAPLLLTAAGSWWYPRTPADPTPSVPYYIFEYARSPDPARVDQAWAAALVLVAAVTALTLGTRAALGSAERGVRSAG